MPMNPNDRIQSWAAKFKADRVKESLYNHRQRVLEHYADAFARLCAIEIGIKKLLDAAGAQTILYVPYLNYGRQLFKLSRQRGISGDAFALAAEILLQKWASRGLDSDLLATIRSQVFDAPAP